MKKRTYFARDLSNYNIFKQFHADDIDSTGSVLCTPNTELCMELRDLEFTKVCIIINDDGFELQCNLGDEPICIENETKIIEALKSETVTEFIFRIVDASEEL